MKLSAILLIAAFLCSNILRADLVYSTFGPDQSYVDGVGLTPGYSAVASSFTPAASYIVDEYEFAAFRESPDTPDTVTFSLYNDIGGLPGNSLETFSLNGLGYPAGSDYPASDPPPGTLTYASVSNPLIVAGQQYWIVMSGINPGDVTWNAGNGETGVATVVAPDDQDDIPSHWTLLPDYSKGAFDLSGTLAPAPEPSSFGILGIGLAAVAIAKRLRYFPNSRNRRLD